MPKDKSTKNDLKSNMKPGFAGTDPNKVRQEIQKDINAGQGAIISRQAGAMRD